METTARKQRIVDILEKRKFTAMSQTPFSLHGNGVKAALIDLCLLLMFTFILCA